MSGRFKYQLDALKKLRQLKLNMAKVELAVATGQVSTCDQKIATSLENVRQLLDDQRQTNDMEYVKLFSHLGDTEQGRIKVEMEKRKIFQAELDRHTSYVAFLSSELKAVEHHESQKREEHKKEFEKAESKKSDEINSIMWNRKFGAER